MDMSELKRGPAAASATIDAQRVENARWHELVSEIGAEIASPLTSALERIHTLTTTGKIDRAGLRALREEVEQARQIGMIGQQLTRFASGRLRQSHERLQLADVLNGVLAHRSRETAARGITLKPSLAAVAVTTDASLLFSLINTTLDWALANAKSQIEFTVDVKPKPSQARLSCRFAHRDAQLDDGAVAAPTPGLDSLLWRLVEQTAWTMGLHIDRRDDSDQITLVIDFPRLAGDEPDSVGALEIDDGFAPSANSQPLAGSHVLVIASRREMRTQIRDSLRNMSLIVDFVNSVEEAESFCREGLPHAIIIESIQSGERFAMFREEIGAEVPDFAFIEIIEEGSTFEMSGLSGSNIARVGRDVLANSLPSALMFELSKGT
ncbi:hypothetical protein BH11PSE9_BH11PSE9_25990 [soil metagenome]